MDYLGHEIFEEEEPEARKFASLAVIQEYGGNIYSGWNNVLVSPEAMYVMTDGTTYYSCRVCRPRLIEDASLVEDVDSSTEEEVWCLESELKPLNSLTEQLLVSLRDNPTEDDLDDEG